MVPKHHYGWWPELERIEVGDRAERSYDDAYEIAYRIGDALGIARPNVPLSWQTEFQRG